MQQSTLKKSQLESQFLEILDKLNTEQRQAVEQTEGPVMVLAGPGTGKTQLLAARIGYILYNTDTQPHNILCLTYTEAGVAAMRDRLKQFIGSSANQVHIHTFHSYCNTIIQDNFHLFGKSELEALDDLERIDIIREIIDELPIDHILKQSNNPYVHERRISSFLRMMKSETWSEEEVLKATAENIENLPDKPAFVYQRKYKDFAKGDLKPAKVEEEKIRMQKLDAAAGLFSLYQAKLKKYHRYDYEDMIIWVQNAFKKNPDLLLQQQENYLYFLVDEFQDTNGSQYELLEMLISYWDEPNIFVVGDDDQSIFEFQGARLHNTKDFIDKYKESITMVMLTQNYRSSSNILSASAHLINYNKTRLDKVMELAISKNLEAANLAVAKSKSEPQINVYKNIFQEQIEIVEQIESEYKNGIDISETAIIYAKHAQVAVIEDLLLKKDIPFQTKKRKNILHHFLIEELLLLLRYIEKESRHTLKGDYYLFKILHFGLIDLNANDFAKLQFYQATYKEEGKLKWRELLANENILDELAVKDKSKLLKLSETFNELILLSGRIAVPEMVQKITNELGVLQFIINSQEQKEYLQVLKTFFQYIESEAKRDKKLKLKEFLDRIDRLVEMNIAVPLTQVYGNEKGVNLVTAHSSKGLEFRTVYIIDCVKRKWEAGNSALFSFSIPDTLSFSGENDPLEAKRRLFYVAMTRAKENLYISYAEDNEKNKPQASATFLDELLEKEHFKQTYIGADEELTSRYLIEFMKTPPALLINENIDVDKLVANFEMSASGLNSYLDCPLRFYYEHILKVPSLSSEAASYGNAMHNALRSYFDLRNKNIAEASKAQLLKYFQKEMESYSSNFSEQGYKFRCDKGNMILSKLYDQQESTWPKKVQLELPLRNVNYKDVTLKGFIDRFDIIDDKTAEIVDYKTGSKPQNKLRKPTKANPLGGTYWRQLIFYKILCDYSTSTNYRIDRAYIASLEPDEKGILNNYAEIFNPEQVEFVGGLIEETSESIKNKEFNNGCGKETCEWCMLVKNHVE